MKYFFFALIFFQSLHLYSMTQSIKDLKHTALKQAIESAILDKKNLNQTDPDGDTFMVACTRDGFNDLVETLLKNGADPNAATDYQLGKATPLMYAVARCNIDCIRLLLSYQAQTNIQDIHGKTALIDAVTSFDQERFSDKSRLVGKRPLDIRRDIIQELFLHGASLRLKTSEGKTAYDFAKKYEFNALITTLDVYKNTYDNAFKRVQETVTQDSIDALHTFSQCMPLTVTDEYGNTLLHYAIQRENPLAALYLLIKEPKLIEEINNLGMTPLHCMVSKGETIPLMHAGLSFFIGMPLAEHEKLHTQLKKELNPYVSTSEIK